FVRLTVPFCFCLCCGVSCYSTLPCDLYYIAVRNGLASNGGTHLPCGLQYQGWPAGALSNQRLTPAISQHPEADCRGCSQGLGVCFSPGPLYLVSCIFLFLSDLLPTLLLILISA
ncbi:unnamed protein product, partial [Staurois parvus]